MKILICGAIWCRECNVMRPLWRNIRLEMPELQIDYLDIDENKEHCVLFSIVEIPTAIFVDTAGKELGRVVGVKHKDEILELINKYKNL